MNRRKLLTALAAAGVFCVGFGAAVLPGLGRAADLRGHAPRRADDHRDPRRARPARRSTRSRSRTSRRRSSASPRSRPSRRRRAGARARERAEQRPSPAPRARATSRRRQDSAAAQPARPRPSARSATGKDRGDDAEVLETIARRPSASVEAGQGPQRRRLAHARQPDLRAGDPGRRADRRPELLHRQVPHPAVPAADLPGRRHPVRRPLGGPRRDQRDRDRLRPQPQRLLRGRARAGCSSCPRRGRPTASTPTRTASRIPTTRSTRSSPPPATCAPPAPRPTCAKAIFAYNHADWYVDSVLMRARVIGGLPSNFVGSLTGLTQGHFPVARARRPTPTTSPSASSTARKRKGERRLARAVRQEPPRHQRLRRAAARR